MYICIHFYIFVYISVYSHLSSKDAPRDLLQNEGLENSWGGLWLELWLFLIFLVKTNLFVCSNISVVNLNSVGG